MQPFREPTVWRSALFARARELYVYAGVEGQEGDSTSFVYL